jgi:predicted NUDIX family phosphoesterase
LGVGRRALDVGRFPKDFLIMSYPTENVLVVRRELFDELGSFQGLNFEAEKYLKAILSRGSNLFIPRPEAEADPAYKQIIPYALISFEKAVLHYVRGKKAGEQRLVAKGSIGIGGHMNETDESLFAMDEQAYRAGVEREVNEEIKIDTPFEDRIVALLNDDSTEVGQVHLGIVHIFKLDEPKVQKREAMITSLGFLTREELMARRGSLETWSQICLDSLERLLR